jgi:hypothetical protein
LVAVGSDETKGKANMSNGLDGRHRDKNGQIERKRSDTRVDSLRETYGEGFAAGTRGDKKLGNLLRDSGAGSLSEYLKGK